LKLYSRYIFYKTLAGFGGLIAIFIALIWFSRAITFVKYVTENGVELSQFFYLFLLVLPWLLLFIIPVSLFTAIIMIYNRLIGSNEITILKNSGLTKIAISRPITSLAIISSLFCFIISFYLTPYANRELRLSRSDFRNNYANLSFSPQTFENLRNMTIYAKDRDEKNRLSGLLLHDRRSTKYSLTITAKSGNIITENDAAMLYMTDGTIQKFNYESHKTEILNFDNYVFNLTENQKNEDKMLWKTKELYIQELLNPEKDLEASDLAQYRAELHQRLTYPLLPIIFSIIALACVLRGEFRRHGSIFNIVLATTMATIFLITTIATYDFIESSAKFVPVLYFNFILFFGVSFRILTHNHRRK